MPVDFGYWKEIYDSCPWATAFTSPLWHAVGAEIAGEDVSFAWRDILTPLRKIKLARGLIEGCQSAVPGVSAGPIAAKSLDTALISEYWRELKERTRGRFLIHLRPDSPFTFTTYTKIPFTTHVLDVKKRAEELSYHHARLIKKAMEKAGIKVKPGRREEDFEAYGEMYAASLARWNKKPSVVYTQAFFDSVRDILVSADAARFYMAWQGHSPQAGALVVLGKTRAVYWHGVSVDDPVPGSAHLLHYKIMEDVESRGLDVYDFGPSPGLAGVQRFKQGFGARPEEHLTVVGPARAFSTYYLKRARHG